MRRLLLSAFILVAAPIGLSSSLADPNVPGASGPEFQVSSLFMPHYSYAYPFGPGADMADSGDFLVVWAVLGAGGLGEMGGRAFDAAGTPRGSDFSLGAGNLFYYRPESPDVSAADGQFIAVWTSYDGTFGSSYEVKAQRFDLQGNLDGQQIRVTPSSFGYDAEVAAEPGGDFIVVWDISSASVSMRRYESVGVPSWPQQGFPASPIAPPDPDVAVDTLGNFTVIWSQNELSGPMGIRGKRFDSAGTPLGTTFQVSQFATGSQRHPAIASMPDGGFVAVWTSFGQDGSLAGVIGRVFDGNAQPLGAEFQVNTTTAGSQQRPDVSADDRGNFMVVWQSGSHFKRGDLVRARQFNRSGMPLGAEFQINQTFSTGQQLPTVAMRDDGESLVTWFSNQSTGASAIRAIRLCAVPNVNGPQDLAVCAGGTATLSLTATGRQPFSYHWRKGGAQLQDDGRISGSASPTLVISSAQPADADVYRCEVLDTCATPQAVLSDAARLTIEPPLPEVTDLTLRLENGNATLTFSWGATVGASDYVVRSDVAPNGGFTVVAGTATDPAGGLSVPATMDTEYFLVAARNPTCGEGPIR